MRHLDYANCSAPLNLIKGLNPHKVKFRSWTMHIGWYLGVKSRMEEYSLIFYRVKETIFFDLYLAFLILIDKKRTLFYKYLHFHPFYYNWSLLKKKTPYSFPFAARLRLRWSSFAQKWTMPEHIKGKNDYRSLWTLILAVVVDSNWNSADALRSSRNIKYP